MDEQEHHKLRTRFLIAGLILVALVVIVKIYESRKNAASSSSQPQDNSLSGSSGGLNVIEIMTQASGPAGAPVPPPNAPQHSEGGPAGPPEPGIAPSTAGDGAVRTTAVSRGAPVRVPPQHAMGMSGIRQGWPPIQPAPVPQQSGKHAIPPVAPPRRQGKHSMPPQPAGRRVA